MKLNNKGFALTSIIYMLIVLFLLLLLLILSNLATRKVVLDKLKYDVQNKFNQGGIKGPTGKTTGEIISQELTTSGDGLYASNTENGRYIYRGQFPNNYIWLDEDGNGMEDLDGNETYRIISFESDGTIKVIRENSIGQYAWDEAENRTPENNNTYCNSGTTYGCNAWGNQNNTYFQGKLLENSFYYKYYSDNTTTNLSQNLTDKTVIKDSSLNIYLNTNWYNSIKLKDYITNHEYKVGGIRYFNGYSEGKGLEREKEEESLNTWKGLIGLMYITDMVESSTNDRCKSVYDNYYYNTAYWYKDNEEDTNKKQHNTTVASWPCTNENWLYGGIYEWSLSLQAVAQNSIWSTNNKGYFHYDGADTPLEVRPSFFLKSGLTLKGSGTRLDPYKIVS